MYLIDKVLDGAGKNEVDFVHVPAKPVCHLSHLVRPNEVDCRVDHPAQQIMQVHHITIFRFLARRTVINSPQLFLIVRQQQISSTQFLGLDP